MCVQDMQGGERSSDIADCKPHPLYSLNLLLPCLFSLLDFRVLVAEKEHFVLVN